MNKIFQSSLFCREELSNNRNGLPVREAVWLTHAAYEQW